MPRKVGTLEKLMMNLWEARAMSAHTVRILFWKFGCLGVCLSPHVFSLMLHISFQSGNLDRPSDFAAVIESLTDRARVWSRHDWLLLVDLKHVNLSEDDGKNMGHTQNPMVYHGLSSLFSLKFGDFFRDIPKKRNWESRPEPDQVSKLRWVLQVVSWNPKWGLWGWVINGHGDQWNGIARPRFVAIKMILKQSTTRMARRETTTAGLDAN